MRVAAIQLNSRSDRDVNEAVAERLVRAAAEDRAELVVLPEKWPVMGSDEDLRASAEPLQGRVLAWASGLARELGIEIVAGSFLEQLPGGGRLANTSLHVARDGSLRAAYRKIHMFDVEVEGRVYRESALEQPGSEIVLSRTEEGIELGMAVCYDLRFPELFRILAVQGALVVSLPSAFTLPTTREHWEILLRARAIENQAFMIAANQCGPHPAGQHSGGHSMIVDPWGVVLAQAAEEEGHIVADLDLERQRRVREGLPSLANRAPAAYRWPEAEGPAEPWPHEAPVEGRVA